MVEIVKQNKSGLDLVLIFYLLQLVSEIIGILLVFNIMQFIKKIINGLNRIKK